MAEGLKLSLKKMPPIGGLLPRTAEILLEWAIEHSFPTAKFTVDSLPPNVNNCYIHARNGQRILSKEARAFRELCIWQLRSLKSHWKPTGVVMLVVIFESPKWITKAQTVRRMDCDNLIKPLCDAIEIGTGVPDQLNWSVHAHKAPSSKTKTTVFLADLGPLVDTYA